MYAPSKSQTQVCRVVALWAVLVFLALSQKPYAASLKPELGLEICERGGVVSWLVGCWRRLIIICALLLEEGVE